MNNQTLLLLTLGLFMGLIVTVAAVNQYLLDKHPPTEVDGLLWRIENALDRVRDLEATIQITQEAFPGDTLRIKVLYVKGPPPTLSMRYLRIQELGSAQSSTAARDEMITVEGDMLRHYLPTQRNPLSERWPGLPLAAIGLGVFQVSQIRADWAAGRTEIRIVQPIGGFSELPLGSLLTWVQSFSQPPASVATSFAISVCAETASTFGRASLFLRVFEEEPTYGLGLASSLDAQAIDALATSRPYVLEVRDAQTNELIRMVWVDRETYLVQRVVTFKQGQRDATLLVQLIAIDQGLTSEEVLVHPQLDAH